jgi:uncharacterized membrane protein
MESLAIAAGVAFVAAGLEIVAVGPSGAAFVRALLRAVLHLRQRREDAYQSLKVYLGKALMLGLEFLVAADVIRTVLIEYTVGGLYSLGILILMRIALGWSIAAETEGWWPWQSDE